MRHSNSGRKLSRTPSHRKALMRNLAKALITHGRITTTEMKAKELRRVVEPLVTLAKANTVAARRSAYRVLNDLKLVKRLFDVIGPTYAGVAGGYTRVLKLAMSRKGDNAPMAVIEFVKKEAAAAAPAAPAAAPVAEAKPAEAPATEEPAAEQPKA